MSRHTQLSLFQHLCVVMGDHSAPRTFQQVRDTPDVRSERQEARARRASSITKGRTSRPTEGATKAKALSVYGSIL